MDALEQFDCSDSKIIAIMSRINSAFIIGIVRPDMRSSTGSFYTETRVPTHLTLVKGILYDVAAFSHAFFESYIFTTSLERAL